MNLKVLFPSVVIVCLIVGLVIVFGADHSLSEVEKTHENLKNDPAEPLKVTLPPELKHVALLFRHTVRAPRVFPPNDSLLKPELFPRGVERSTREGLIATRNATLLWKQWYKDFIKGNPNEVFARSSQADRCFETMSMVVDTWFPSPDDLPLSQVSIRMPPRGQDKYVENCGNMRHITRDYDPQFRIPDSIYMEEGFQTVGAYVDFLRARTKLVNESVNFFYMAFMEGFLSLDYENRYSREDHWMLNYPKTREFSRLYLLNNSINVMAPYYAHFLMNGIADQLDKAARQVSQFKLSLFSFHDLNLLSVLRAFGINDKATDPLAAIGFELWKYGAEYRVALRMSEGLTTKWEYKPDIYLKVFNATNEGADLSEVLNLMRNFYQPKINLDNCGYFGNDAKV